MKGKMKMTIKRELKEKVITLRQARKDYERRLLETAQSHQTADKDCGRNGWECSCGACNIVRRDPARFEKFANKKAQS